MRKRKTFFTLPFKVGSIEKNPDISPETAVKLLLKKEFGENFFYSYVVDGERIFYAGFPGKTVITGKVLPVFYPALLKEGCYYYRWGKSYFIFFRTKDDLQSKISTGIPRDCVDVTEVKAEKIPKTLYLKWSMDKTVIPVFLISFLVFLVSLGYFAAQKGKERVITPKVNIKVVMKKKPSCSIGEILEKIAVKSSLYGGGIEEVEYRDGRMVVQVAFPDEFKAKAFASDFGGNVRENKVLIEKRLNCSTEE